MHLRRFFVCALLLLAPPAFAWGVLGHRIVAQLAQRQLTPAASIQVDELLALQGTRKLADVATWADDLRESDPALFKRTSRLHFVNFHSGDCVYDPPRDCPRGKCVVAATEHYAAILGDRSRPGVERAQALDFVVHFVADAHQPLHASYRDDAGGNDYQVRWHDRGTNLHAIWDSTLLNARHLGYRAYADEIAANTARTKPIPEGTPAQWAEESCRIVRDGDIYPRSRVIDERYVQRERPIAEERLRQAGARLAALLNRELQ
ncbi:MAG TPA: S1/P1 nuclease [Rhodanobacteraceae bacterium]|nr:S1/P1 nuclease [Rhodanobacteraceae bacterium]